MAKVTMESLEEKIGLKPRQGNAEELYGVFQHDPNKKQLAIAWCILNGITVKSANAAMLMSLAKAYAITAYLSTWRKNCNPGFAALHDIDFDEAPESAAEAYKPSQEAASIPADAAERLATSVAPLIKRLVTGEVDDKFKDYVPNLSEAAKQKIKDIAGESGSAQAELIGLDVKDWVKKELDRRIPPQEIIVKNVDTGKSTPIGVQHFQFQKLLRACQIRNHQGHRPNIWLTGPTGSGKTTAAENIANALGLEFGADSSLDADYKVYGFFNASGQYMRTTFRKIFEHGGVYVADEIDNWNQSALVALNAPLANGLGAFPDGMIKRHPDCIIIACANTWGHGATNDYVGRNKLDAASLDRFQPKLDWPTDEKLEMSIAKSMDNNFGPVWCEVVQKARANVKRQGLKIIVSQRSTINGIAMIQAGFDVIEAAAQTFLAGLAAEQVKALNVEDDIRKCDRAVKHSTEAQEEVSEEALDPFDIDNGAIIIDSYKELSDVEA